MSDSRSREIQAVTLFDRGGEKQLKIGRHKAGLYESNGKLLEEEVEVVELEEPIPVGKLPEIAKYSDRVRDWMEDNDVA